MSKSAVRGQGLFFKGIYEFEDPSGAMLAVKVPPMGSVDLFDGTAVLVRPSQCAIFMYKGEIADVLRSGTHYVSTENVPLLTRMANWKFGLQSPLRAELYFFSGQEFTGRRWGSAQPFLVNMKGMGMVPFRAYGMYNVSMTNPKSFYTRLMGTRATYNLADLEEFIQGQILEALPEAFSHYSSMEEVAKAHKALSQHLEKSVSETLRPYGLELNQVQVMAALPSQEILQAMESKTAIQLVGSKEEYLLYKAANAIGAAPKNGSDPMQVLMGLMLSRSVAGAPNSPRDIQMHNCPSCSQPASLEAKFCQYCGGKLK